MPFEKDFGYLLPFLDRVAEAASTLEDAAARQELLALMRDERARWARIQALLSGAKGAASSRPEGAAEPGTPLTVGSLRARR